LAVGHQRGELPGARGRSDTDHEEHRVLGQVGDDLTEQVVGPPQCGSPQQVVLLRAAGRAVGVGPVQLTRIEDREVRALHGPVGLGEERLDIDPHAEGRGRVGDEHGAVDRTEVHRARGGHGADRGRPADDGLALEGGEVRAPHHGGRPAGVGQRVAEGSGIARDPVTRATDRRRRPDHDDLALRRATGPALGDLAGDRSLDGLVAIDGQRGLRRGLHAGARGDGGVGVRAPRRGAQRADAHRRDRTRAGQPRQVGRVAGAQVVEADARHPEDDHPVGRAAGEVAGRAGVDGEERRRHDRAQDGQADEHAALHR
jgi:hypothetical protein